MYRRRKLPQELIRFQMVKKCNIRMRSIDLREAALPGDFSVKNPYMEGFSHCAKSVRRNEDWYGKSTISML